MTTKKNLKIGDKVDFQGFACIITGMFLDDETRDIIATIKPLEFKSFEKYVDIKLLKRI